VSDTTIDPREWMAWLPDETLLCDLTIPGTHDTCARHGGDWPTTQTRPLLEQLDGGVRFLDIRCRHEDDAFRIFHGIADQHLEYGVGVQQVCLDFLRAHPSETLVMSVKPEGVGDGNALTFEQVFRGYIERFDCAAQWRLADTMPTLGEARGRIVLFRRFDTDAPETVLGLNPLPWPDNTIFETRSAASFHVQDAFRIPTLAGREIKWGRIEALLDAAKRGGRTAFVNFCSGTGMGSHPRLVADEINPRVAAYLTRNPKGRFGWLLLDFETDALNRRIFETNL
jgi:1-phosphatidylinositol phosphodiesterase